MDRQGPEEGVGVEVHNQGEEVVVGAQNQTAQGEEVGGEGLLDLGEVGAEVGVLKCQVEGEEEGVEGERIHWLGLVEVVVAGVEGQTMRFAPPQVRPCVACLDGVFLGGGS